MRFPYFEINLYSFERNPFPMGKKGQGASEYLMILGAVLIVALAAASLIGYFGGFAGDITSQESKAYWVGYARPFSIYDAFYNGNGGICRAGDSAPYPPQIELSVKNNDKYPLNLTAIYISGNTTAIICSPPGAASLPPYRFAPNEQKTVAVRVNASACANRNSVDVNVVFRYDSPYLSNKSQNGSAKLVVGCT